MSATTRVLVVDPEPMAQEIARRRLGDAGFEVTFAGSVMEALLIGRRGEVDVVLLAQALPDGDGWELVEALRKVRALDGVAILLLASHRDADRVEAALRAGADDLLRKPLDRVELVARVRLCARMRRQEAEIQRRDARLEELAARLHQRPELDPFEDAEDRAALEARLDEEIERSIRYQRGLSLLRVDVDRLDGVQAEFGQAAGDAALRELKKRVRGATRGHDIVVRGGSDGCLVVAPSTDERSARAIAERVRGAVNAEPFAVVRPDGTEHPIRVSVCIGVVTLFGAGRASSVRGSDLLARAEAALARARQAGPNRLCAVVWS